MSERKVVHVPAEIHKRLRVKAAQKETTVQALVIAAILDSLQSTPRQMQEKVK